MKRGEEGERIVNMKRGGEGERIVKMTLLLVSFFLCLYDVYVGGCGEPLTIPHVSACHTSACVHALDELAA